MIRIAHECGADLIKAQAFRPEDITWGSMPLEFYEQCSFSQGEYLDLIFYARSIGNDLFYSIFSEGFAAVRAIQSWHKVAGQQTKQGMAKTVPDEENVIISVPPMASCPKLKHATVLHVSDYCTSTPHLWHIETLSDYLDRPVGYSDHTIGIQAALTARREMGATVIEKHFCLMKNEAFGGQVYRDTLHGATPAEFEKLAKELSK